MIKIDISKARAIPGWMTEPELEWLGAAAKTHHRIVEVGSHLGRSTRALGDHTPGWVLAFDDWQGPRFDQGHPLAVAEWDPVALFAEFQRNLADLLESKRVRILRGSHADCSILPVEFLQASAGEEKPDMVFIDGDHEAGSVRRDLLIWAARLAPGGLLCGHDFAVPGCEGVAEAVRASGFAWEQVPGTSIWKMNGH